MDTIQKMDEINTLYPLKTKTIAYICAIALGSFCGHRFYLGKNETAILQLSLIWGGIIGVGFSKVMGFLYLIGFIWWIIDLFLIPSMVWEKNEELKKKLYCPKFSKQNLREHFVVVFERTFLQTY